SGPRGECPRPSRVATCHGRLLPSPPTNGPGDVGRHPANLDPRPGGLIPVPGAAAVCSLPPHLLADEAGNGFREDHRGQRFGRLKTNETVNSSVARPTGTTVPQSSHPPDPNWFSRASI